MAWMRDSATQKLLEANFPKKQEFSQRTQPGMIVCPAINHEIWIKRSNPLFAFLAALRPSQRLHFVLVDFNFAGFLHLIAQTSHEDSEGLGLFILQQ